MAYLRDGLKKMRCCFRTQEESAEEGITVAPRLPKDHKEILKRAVVPPIVDHHPLQQHSDGELYSLMCKPFLIDEGRKMFALDEHTGSKCFMFSARDVDITFSSSPSYWKWGEAAASRFKEVAELVAVCWLEMRCWIHTSELSPGRIYAAYLVFKLTSDSYGLGGTQEAFISVAGKNYVSKVCLNPPTPTKRSHEDSPEATPESDEGHAADQHLKKRSSRPPGPVVPSETADGWMELLLGEFDNNGRVSGQMWMTLREIQDLNWKGGLIVEGIEIRPKDTAPMRRPTPTPTATE